MQDFDVKITGFISKDAKPRRLHDGRFEFNTIPRLIIDLENMSAFWNNEKTKLEALKRYYRAVFIYVDGYDLIKQVFLIPKGVFRGLRK